jgi:hypothetical protein
VRKPTVVMIGLAAVMLCFAALASAGVVAPTKVSAGVHKAKRPALTYTTTGRITYPRRYCLAGTTSSAYCVTLTAKKVCNGRVSLTVKLGKDPLLAASNKTIARASGKVKSNCTYSIKTKLKTKPFAAKKSFAAHAKGATVKVSFGIRFLGNAVLNPRNARTQTVKVSVKQP